MRVSMCMFSWIKSGVFGISETSICKFEHEKLPLFLLLSHEITYMWVGIQICRCSTIFYMFWVLTELTILFQYFRTFQDISWPCTFPDVTSPLYYLLDKRKWEFFWSTSEKVHRAETYWNLLKKAFLVHDCVLKYWKSLFQDILVYFRYVVLFLM